MLFKQKKINIKVNKRIVLENDTNNFTFIPIFNKLDLF